MGTNDVLQRAGDFGDEVTMEKVKDFLRQQFIAIDPPSLSDSDSWWSSFLVDI